MGKKVLAAKSGRPACSCAAAGGGIAAKRAKGAKAMKPSGVAWLGDIPEGWEMRRLKTCFSIVSGSGFKEHLQGRTDGDYPVFKARDIGKADVTLNYSKNWITSDEVETEGFKIIPANSILMPKIGEAMRKNSRAISGVACCVDNNCQGLLPRMVDVKLSYYLLCSIDVRAFDNGGAIPCINNQAFLDFSCPLPPLPEQRAIADYLDEKCGAIDVAIAEAKKGIEEYKAWKISLIDDIVCNGIDRHQHRKETGEVWLADIPIEWDFMQIRYLFALRDERNNKPLKDVNLISLYTDKGVVQHADLEKTTGNKASTADGYKLVYENDIVVNIILCWMGAVGRSAYNGVTSPAYDVYRPIDSAIVLSRYYHYLFRTPRFNGKCYEEGRGIMMMRWRTYSSEFRAIKVPVPPFEEQQAIADYLDEKCAAIDAMVTEKESLIADLEAYKKSLIYETVTGKREVASNSMVK